MERDLFEEVRHRVGCMYISDLPLLKAETDVALHEICLEHYPEWEVADFMYYVFGPPKEK